MAVSVDSAIEAIRRSSMADDQAGPIVDLIIELEADASQWREMVRKRAAERTKRAEAKAKKEA